MTHQPRTRVALAGFGAWGQMHAEALSALADAEITAVFCHGDASADMAQEKLPNIPIYRDYRAMLAQAEAEVISVAVPNVLHSAYAVAALDSGRDVFLEKPLGIDLDQCDQVIDAQQRTGRLVALNHELRVSRQWGALRDAIAAGRIGTVRYQNFSLFRHKFRLGSGGWRYDPAMVGSWILEELVHFFDLLIWYARENGPPAQVEAIGNRTAPHEPGVLWDNMTVVLSWDDGSYATLAQCLSGFEHHTAVEIAGTDGAARTWWSGVMDRTLDPRFELKIQASGEEHATAVEIPLSGEVFELRENLRRALEGFRHRQTILGPEEARLSVAVCLAAERAARERRPVRIEA